MTLLIGATAAAMLAAGLTIWQVQSDDLSAGPLRVSSGIMASSALVPRPGVPTTWGWPGVDNPTNQPAVIDKVIVPSRAPGFVRKIVVTSRANQINAMRHGWVQPRHGRYRPVRGAIVPAGGGLSIVVKLVIPRDGRFVAGPVIIDYHIGGHRYRTTEHMYGLVCAPLHSFHDCSIPNWVTDEKAPPG